MTLVDFLKIRIRVAILCLPAFISSTLAIGQEDSLGKMAAQMVMIGFRGTAISDTSAIAVDIRKNGIGGVILFEYDNPSASRPRNIESSEQLMKLTSDLQSMATIPLFIAIDQEGGMVNRLKTRYGFPRTVPAQYLGTLMNADTSAHYAKLTALTLKSTGINMNFAPVLDLNINPDCPVIGRIKRSYSANPVVAASEASYVYRAQSNAGIISVYKHFPGHGSAKSDSHLGFTDITDTWNESELKPYKILLNSGMCDAIMTAHVFNAHIDSIWPASLSTKTVQGLLRQQLEWKGVVISDDMMMGAITDNFTFETAVKHALLAGVDILVFSNNIKTFDPLIASKAITCIKKLVNSGQIPLSVVTNSYLRILKLKNKYHLK
jgi:beta-N-acetylhexosaminidase